MLLTRAGNAWAGGGHRTTAGPVGPRNRLRLEGVGLRIVEQLALSGVPTVVVDDNPVPALARLVEAWPGVQLVTGPSRAEETLMEAGLGVQPR